MKIILQTQQLLAPLSRAVSAIEARATLPILSCALLRGDGETLTITGSDLEIELVAHTPLESEPFAFAVNGMKAHEILRTLPSSADVTLTLADKRLTITCRKSRFNLATLDASQYPEFDRGDSRDTLTLHAQALKTAIGRAITAAGVKDFRYYLNGLFFEVDGNRLNIVASDGHRLTQYPVAVTAESPTTCGIVPRDAARLLAKLLPDTQDEITLRMGDRAVWIELPGLHFASKLIDGKYPDYRHVIPSRYVAEASVDKVALLAAIARTTVTSNEHYASQLTVSGGELSLQSANAESEESTDSVPFETDQELQSGFSLRYLADALNIIDSDQARLAFCDKGSVTVSQESTDGFSIVMPMRIWP